MYNGDLKIIVRLNFTMDGISRSHYLHGAMV